MKMFLDALRLLKFVHTHSKPGSIWKGTQFLVVYDNLFQFNDVMSYAKMVTMQRHCNTVYNSLRIKRIEMKLLIL